MNKSLVPVSKKSPVTKASRKVPAKGSGSGNTLTTMVVQKVIEVIAEKLSTPSGTIIGTRTTTTRKTTTTTVETTTKTKIGGGIFKK